MLQAVLLRDSCQCHKPDLSLKNISLWNLTLPLTRGLTIVIVMGETAMLMIIHLNISTNTGLCIISSSVLKSKETFPKPKIECLDPQRVNDLVMASKSVHNNTNLLKDDSLPF